MSTSWERNLRREMTIERNEFKAQRDALLAALIDLCEQIAVCRCRVDFVLDDARAAIAAVEGDK